MWRSFSIGSVGTFCLLLSSVAVAQDSGPGPDAAGGDHAYDVTVIRFINVSNGTFTFTADPVETPEGTTPAITTTGTFTSVVNSQTKTGTWHAVDLGNFSIWYASAEGDSAKLSAVGYATPDIIAGRLTTTSTANSSRSRFLRALFSSSYFFGTAAEVEPPTEPATMGN